MVSDRKLAGDFWLHEAPCWAQATEVDVAQLQETAARVLQPIRNVFGPVVISSWMRWSDGCTPRTGAHSVGGTVDFYTPAANLREVWEWGAVHLIPTGYIGRWIYEPFRPASSNAPQGEHIHVAPRADMVELNGDSRIQVLEEDPAREGSYILHYEGWGTEGNPIELPGIEVTAVAPGLLGFLGALLLIMSLAEPRPAHAT